MGKITPIEGSDNDEVSLLLLLLLLLLLFLLSASLSFFSSWTDFRFHGAHHHHQNDEESKDRVSELKSNKRRSTTAGEGKRHSAENVLGARI